MKKENNQLPPIIGGNSLLLIFAVLCLTVLTLLMIHTAVTDSRLSDVSAGITANYYAADREAETAIARLRSGEMPQSVRQDGDVYFCECDISDTQKLVFEIINNEGHWEIVSKYTVSSNR